MTQQPIRLQKQEEPQNMWFLLKPSPLMILLIVLGLFLFLILPLTIGSCTESNLYYYHLN